MWKNGPAVLRGGKTDTSVRLHPTAPGLELNNFHQERNKLFLLLPSVPACQEGKTSKEMQWGLHSFPQGWHHTTTVFTQQPCTVSQERAVV